MLRFKVFLEIHIYKGMKCQPNYKIYWEKRSSIFYYPIISNIMNQERFIELHKCLFITNLATYEYNEKDESLYNKFETNLMACR